VSDLERLEPPKICPECGSPVKMYETGRVLCEAPSCEYEWFGYRQNYERPTI
jgi:uncharacterized Zn finger protein (UPF0148 family)